MKLSYCNIFLICVLVYLLIYGIVTQIRENLVLQDDPKLGQLKDKLKPLFARKDFTGVLEPLNKRDLLNEIGLYKGDKSYTINKSKTFMCLYDENGHYYNENILLYVLIHEYCHSINITIGHDENFNNIFDALLAEAIKMNIYNPSIPVPQNYCTYND